MFLSPGSKPSKLFCLSTKIINLNKMLCLMPRSSHFFHCVPMTASVLKRTSTYVQVTLF